MKKTTPLFTLLLFLASTVLSQTVKIGKQKWMTHNLDVSTFRNGDVIPEAKTEAEFKKAGDNKKPAWCYYGNDPENGKKYGKLYNWFVVNDSRGLAPAGFHIPSDAEWTKLSDNLGSMTVAGKKMKSKSEWKVDSNSTNSSGFSGLPGGYSYNGEFYFIGSTGKWWSSTEDYTYYAWFRGLYDISINMTRYYSYKIDGYSVRCLKD
jgi:uncharacterized protein (TIGR02145 family)